MSPFEFLTHLRKLGVTLRVDGEQLQIDAPAGVLTPALRDELVGRKAQILEIVRASQGDAARSVLSISRICRDDPLPLSHAQQRLWFLEQMEPQGAAYIMASATRLHGALQVEALDQALTAVVARHEPLRSVFESREGVPFQRILPPHPLRVAVIDLTGLPRAQREAAASDYAQRDAEESFDLEKGPLLRARLLRLADDDWVLLLAVHHIVFDAWSGAVFVRELAQLYAAARSGIPAELSPLEFQYVDFVAAQRRRLDEGARRSLLEYWTRQLGGALTPLRLPADVPRKGRVHRSAAFASAQIDADLTATAKTLARREGVSLSMVLIATFNVLLRRLSGQDDIIIGTPVAGRTVSATESLIGFFINTVAIRTTFAQPTTSFIEVLRQVRDAALEAYAHQEMPFDEIVTALKVDRTLATTPVFQVLFNHLNMAQPTIELAEITSEPFGARPVESKFDLTLYVQESADQIELLAAYDTDLFVAARIEEVLAQFVGLLRQAAHDPGGVIDGYSLVTERAAHVLPNPATPLPAQVVRSNSTLLYRDLAKHGAKIALSAASGEWTYASLDERANRVAAALVRLGLKRGDVVAICARRDPLLVCAMLGVLRAGGAFALLDPAYPEARLTECWRVADCRALISLEGVAVPPAMLAAAAEKSESIQLYLSIPVLEEPGAGGAGVDLPEISADDLAYVAFTSGTTGGVKAISGNHGPVAHFLDWQRTVFDVRARDRFSMLSGLAHDPLLRDVFAPLASGATLQIPSEDLLEDPVRLGAWVREKRVTVMHLTPATAEWLCAVVTQPADDLRLACFGGDVLTAATLERWSNMAPQARNVNFYGATETPQAMGYQVIAGDDMVRRGRIPIGHGIEGVQLLIINAAQRLAGVGEVGEIVVRTPHLSRGYVGDAELTKQRFVASPSNGDVRDRCYRTGDLGRYLLDGSVEFVGRRDDQVKIRGFRVELREIESALQQHAAVVEAAVVLRGDPEQHLVAYVVGAGDAASYRDYLRRRLPAYMVPTYYVEMASLPRTPNKKIDRNALPPPDGQRTAAEYVALSSETEKAIATVFEDVLGVAPVGATHHFFELGGHSLLAARAVARLRDRLGVELPVRAMFDAPTVGGLAAEVERLRSSGVAISAVPITLVERNEPLPLSYAQQRLWFLHQLEPDNAVSNLVWPLRLRGTLQLDVLRDALSTLVVRHEALRTVFVASDGVPYAVVRPAQPIEISIFEPEALEPIKREHEAHVWMRELAARPMDLEQGPLFSVAVARLSEREHWFVVLVHHIVADGWSLGVFIREFGELYAAGVQRRAATLPMLPYQFVDFVQWHRRTLKDATSGQSELDRQLAYWKNRLAGSSPASTIPSLAPRPVTPTYRGAAYNFDVDKDVTRALRNFARQANATLFMIFCAALHALVYRYSGQKDVTIGAPVAGRSQPDAERLIGPFLNMLPLRAQLREDESFAAFIGRVKADVLDALAHQHAPFEQIVEVAGVPRNSSVHPLFQIALAFQNFPLPSLDLPGLRLTSLPIDRGVAQFDLNFFIMEIGDELKGRVEYSTDLYDERAIGLLVERYLQLIHAAVTLPDTLVARLPLVTAVERAGVIAAFDAAAMDYPRERTVVDLFSEQVARQASRVAVSAGDEHLTYSQLDARSWALARYLRARGVRRDVLVGLCVERSVDMVVGMLGILKAGGAYVPLDPAFPAERLRFMLEDCGTTCVVTQTAFAGLFSAVETRVDLDADAEAVAAHGDEPLPGQSGSLDRAYVIYTSGSTGRPKGVEIEHRALTNFLCSMLKEPGMSATDVLAAVTTVSFDIAGLELWLPLICGARVEVVRREAATSPQELADVLEHSGATVLQATPATWRMLLDSGWTGSRRLKALCGGEAMGKDLAQRLAPVCGELWNLYGPTETTIWSSVARIETADEITIGRPIANTRMYVLDAHLEPVPSGVVGELWIGGDGVARGYLRRPELTAERFVDDPFYPGRMYRTGDLATYWPDGRLACLGRIDSQVKIRGYRIELGEIESVLGEHPDVSECAVVVRDIGGDRRVIAYMVGDGETAAYREYLRARLPEYMVPSGYVPMAMLPRTPNNKIDRNALPAPDALPAVGAEYVAPRGAMETTMAGIWCDVLQRERIGTDDDFFDIGGHSLLATRVLSRVNAAFGVRLSVRDVFSFPTVSKLTQHVETVRWISHGRPTELVDSAEEFEEEAF